MHYYKFHRKLIFIKALVWFSLTSFFFILKKIEVFFFLKYRYSMVYLGHTTKSLSSDQFIISRAHTPSDWLVFYLILMFSLSLIIVHCIIRHNYKSTVFVCMWDHINIPYSDRTVNVIVINLQNKQLQRIENMSNLAGSGRQQFCRKNTMCRNTMKSCK